VRVQSPIKGPESSSAKKMDSAPSIKQESESEEQEVGKQARSRSTSRSRSLASIRERTKGMQIEDVSRGTGKGTPLRESRHPSRSSREERSSGDADEEASEESGGTGSSEEDDTSMEEDGQGARDKFREKLTDKIKKAKEKKKALKDYVKVELRRRDSAMDGFQYELDSVARQTHFKTYKMLMKDAERASKVLHVDGFPKWADGEQRRAFLHWALDSSRNKDKEVEISTDNNRGHFARAVQMTFNSAFHRNDFYEWRKKKDRYYFDEQSKKETWDQLYARKELSEDSRIRGRYLETAMECLSKADKEDQLPFKPVWTENAVVSKATTGHGEDMGSWRNDNKEGIFGLDTLQPSGSHC
jgi:hypothetical protein